MVNKLLRLELVYEKNVYVCVHTHTHIKVQSLVGYLAIPHLPMDELKYKMKLNETY